MRSQKLSSVVGNEGWTSPVVSLTRGARGRAICWILAARAGLLACFEEGILGFGLGLLMKVDDSGTLED